REFNGRGLPPAAQTWQTLRLNPTYIAGIGAVVTPTSLISERGEPVLWLGDLNPVVRDPSAPPADRKSTRLNSSHVKISYAVFCYDPALRSFPTRRSSDLREFNGRGLPPAAQTWQTLRLNPTYIAGIGAVVTPTSLISERGEPVLWLGDLNPVVRDPSAPP